MRRWCLFIWLVAACVSSAIAADPNGCWVGKKVMVNNWKAKLGENGKHLKTYVELGDIFTVSKTNGDWLWIGRGWIDKNDVVPLDQAIAYFTAQIARSPNVVTYHDRAIAHQKLRELDEAIADESEVIRIAKSAGNNSNVAAGYGSRAYDWRLKGEYDIAIADYDEAIRFNPNGSPSRNGRGVAHGKKGNYGKAIADYEEAIRLNPKLYWPYNNRAWIWATCPDEQFRDGAMAIESATKACELADWRSADELDTLAAAYAEKGDYGSAIKWETKAIELGTESQSDKKPEDLRARLELYKSGKPYREEPKGK